jgi:hypothetical protein
MMIKLGKVTAETMGAKWVEMPEITGDLWFPL